MMDILLASHGFPPTHSAGAERRTERMARWLASQGHRVVVFTVESVQDPDPRLETREQDGFLVHRLYYDINSGDKFQNFYDNPFVGDSLRYVLSRQQFDLVHIVSGYLLGVPAIEITKELGLPLVITLTEYWFICARLNLIQLTGALCTGPDSIQKCTRCLLENKRRYRLAAQSSPFVMDVFWPMSHRLGLTTGTQQAVSDRQARLRNALAKADLVICPSQFLIDKFQKYRFDTEKFVHIRQGLAARVGDQKSTESIRQPDEALHIVYVGQIKYHKGVDLLLDAVMRLLDANEKVTLDLWGNEQEDPQYVQALKSRSMRYPTIRWNGQFTGDRIWDILSETDVVVVPSRWYENSPNVILEAFSMQVPIITTNLGGMAELVTHEENGLLFEIDRADELYQSLWRLMHEDHLLPKLRQGIPQIKNLHDEMQEIVSHYERLAKIYY
jgi:glycosyltransferase involved in cell wall biosynthesis